MNLKIQNTAFVKGTILRLNIGDHLPVESRFVALQLPDGQTIETNVRNLADYKSEDASAVDVVKELAQARKLRADAALALEASRAEVLALQAELGAIRELLAASEARTAALEAMNARTGKAQRGK